MRRGRRPLLRRIGRIAFGLFLLLVAELLVRYARGVDWHAVGEALAGYGWRSLLAVLGLTALSYVVYGAYDLAARRYSGHDQSTRRVMLIAGSSYAFALNLGALVGGAGFRFRMYSLANLPMGQVDPPPLVAYYSPTASIVASTGAAGAWLDLGTVRLARDAGGMTALALALSFNDGLGDAFSTNVKIRAVTVEPYSADLEGGGFGDVDDKEGA